MRTLPHRPSHAVCAICALLFLIGCGQKATPPPQPAVAAPPGWFTQLHNPNDGFLYGVGAGASLRSAKEKGLGNIAAGIQVSVSSETKSTIQRSGLSDTSRFREDIVAKVKAIQFNNPEVDRHEHLGRTHYVRMKVAIDSLIESDTTQLDSLGKEIAQSLNLAAQSSKLERFFILQALGERLDTAISLTLRLESLYRLPSRASANRLDTAALRNEYTNTRGQANALLRQMSFAVVNETSIPAMSTVLVDLLSQKKLKTTAQVQPSSDAMVIIRGDVVRAKVYNDFQSKIQLTITIQGLDKKTHQSKTFAVAAYSPASHEDAESRLASATKKVVAKEKVLTDLGLE